jgi:hypothetical protein
MDVNGRMVNKKTLVVDGVDIKDMPDFCDAHFSHAEFQDGGSLTDSELETLSEEYAHVVNEMAFESMLD